MESPETLQGLGERRVQLHVHQVLGIFDKSGRLNGVPRQTAGIK